MPTNRIDAHGRATRRKGGQLACLAGRLCQRADFQAFCRAHDAEQAAEYIRRTCGVASRAELDHDQKAARLFHEQVRRPFVERRAG